MVASLVVNTPANVVGTVQGTKAIFRSGGLRYKSFERKIEKITFNDNVAIVMGGEVIKPQGTQPNAGKTVRRRLRMSGCSRIIRGPSLVDRPRLSTWNNLWPPKLPPKQLLTL